MIKEMFITFLQGGNCRIKSWTLKFRDSWSYLNKYMQTSILQKKYGHSFQIHPIIGSSWTRWKAYIEETTLLAIEDTRYIAEDVYTACFIFSSISTSKIALSEKWRRAKVSNFWEFSQVKGTPLFRIRDKQVYMDYQLCMGVWAQKP